MTHPTHPATVVGALHEGERAALEVHSINGSPNDAPRNLCTALLMQVVIGMV